MPIDLHEYSDLGFERDVLLLGNGASVAVHGGFRYTTLHALALQHNQLPTAAPVFGALNGTTDFELVLRQLAAAQRVNDALGVQHHLGAAHQEVRGALIECVRLTHPDYASVIDDLKRAGKFISTFTDVLSLNYDMVVYWALLLQNDNDKYSVKDCFRNGSFHSNFGDLRNHPNANYATLVFYPHGQLSLTSKTGWDVKKLSAGANDALTAIENAWNAGSIPLFVAEGDSATKLDRIQTNHYLRTVFEDVIPAASGDLTVYGWSFSEQDQHLVNQLARSDIERVAISTYTAGQTLTEEHEDALEDLQTRIRRAFRDAGRGEADLPEIFFYDSADSGCWSNP